MFMAMGKNMKETRYHKPSARYLEGLFLLFGMSYMVAFFGLHLEE
jgi:hypothetical protein